ADEDPARSLGQGEIGGLIGNADMRGRRGLESAAQSRALQRRDERNVPARHHLETGVAIERERQAFRASRLPALRRPAPAQPAAEIVAMAEDDAAFRLLAGAVDGWAHRFHT